MISFQNKTIVFLLEITYLLKIRQSRWKFMHLIIQNYYYFQPLQYRIEVLTIKGFNLHYFFITLQYLAVLFYCKKKKKIQKKYKNPTDTLMRRWKFILEDYRKYFDCASQTRSRWRYNNKARFAETFALSLSLSLWRGVLGTLFRPLSFDWVKKPAAGEFGHFKLSCFSCDAV